MALGALMRGAQRTFPGALPGSIVAAVLTLLLAWWLFSAVRRAALVSGFVVLHSGSGSGFSFSSGFGG